MLVQPWVNDAAYFDGTGFAEINFPDSQDQMSATQRFEQEVKLLSDKGILLLLQNEVAFIHSPTFPSPEEAGRAQDFLCFSSSSESVPVSGCA